MDDTVSLACELIRRPSVTPRDEGCLELIAGRLAPLGFEIHPLRYGEVENLWAVHGGKAGPCVALLGHTDVVPTGPVAQWQSDPFTPALRDGRLYGRGAADMKGSVAAFVTALSNFVRRHPDHPGRVALLLTSDEEGPATDGTVRVIEWLKSRGERIDCCLVGEPTCAEQFGDTIKNGRRGSLGGRLVVRGIQGHVAYPHQARNPIHQFAPALARLAAEKWDDGNAHFPPTTFQVSNLQSGTGADNVIPGELTASFNFRFSTAVTEVQLRERTVRLLDAEKLDYHIAWRLSGQPFLTPGGRLVEALDSAIEQELGLKPVLSTTGGTSDGRFVAPTGAEVVEFGPLNGTIHKIDEWVAENDLPRLARIYLGVLERLLA